MVAFCDYCGSVPCRSWGTLSVVQCLAFFISWFLAFASALVSFFLVSLTH